MRVSSGSLRLRAALTATLTLLVLFQPSAAVRADTAEISGQISYLSRNCFTDESRVKVPLAGAKIVFKRDDAVVGSAVLRGDGSFLGQVEGSEPVDSFVRLESDKLRVAPLDTYMPYKLQTGEMTPGATNERTFVTYNKAAAANIWYWMNKGMEVAVDIRGPAFPAVKVSWDRGEDLSDISPRKDIAWSVYRPDKDEVLIASGQHHHEWEKFVLLHELGHHVQFNTAPPGDKYYNREDNGTHYADGVYPKAPGLAWAEGFATAFAAAVADTTSITRNCKPHVDLEANPATPRPKNPRLAQYNETAAAGVLVRLFDHLGPDRISGLHKVLRAARNYRQVARHTPNSMRQVRDALITGRLEEETYQSHQAIDDIFIDGGRMNWKFRTWVTLDGDPAKGRWAPQEVALELRGPYSRCKMNGPGGRQDLDGDDPLMSEWYGAIGARGGLPYTWEDDCLLYGGDGQTGESEPIGRQAYVGLDFPYLSDQTHYSSPFVLSAKYVCWTDEESDNPSYHCTDSRRIDIVVRMGLGNDKTLVDVSLERGQKTDIVRFNAQGDCEIIAGAVRPRDCSI